MHLLTHLRQKFPRSKRFYAGKILLFLLAYIFLIFMDLHYLGSKNQWNLFDKIRIKTYLKSGILVGYLTPPIGPLKAIHYSSVLGNAFLNKELPEIENLEFTRQILMRTEGNPSKRRNLGLNYSDSFVTKLRQHENQAMLQFYKTGKTSYTKDYAQTLKFSSYGIPMYDIWMVYVTTNIVNRVPKTAYLVWGMGVATDKNSEGFFGGQMGILQHILPLKWFNKLESQGLAKGYWSLMTEDNETSEFSYTKRFLQPYMRKSIWFRQTYLRHHNGLGKNANEIISLSL